MLAVTRVGQITSQRLEPSLHCACAESRLHQECTCAGLMQADVGCKSWLHLPMVSLTCCLLQHVHSTPAFQGVITPQLEVPLRMAMAYSLASKYTGAVR